MKTAELVRRSGLPRQTVYRALRDEQTLSLDQIWSIAEGLEVEPASLLPIASGQLADSEARILTAVRARDQIGLASALIAAGLPASPPLRAPETDLLNAIRATDGRAVVKALGRLLPERELAYVTAANLADDDREHLVSVLARLADGLGSLATDVHVELRRQSTPSEAPRPAPIEPEE